MARLLLVLSVVVLLVQWARPSGDPRLAVRVEARRVTLDTTTRVAVVRYTLKSRGGGPVYLRGSTELPPVTVERRLDARWLVHRHQPHACAERPPRAWREPLATLDGCTARVALATPGRFRLRVAYSTGRTGPLIPAYSGEFEIRRTVTTRVTRASF